MNAVPLCRWTLLCALATGAVALVHAGGVPTPAARPTAAPAPAATAWTDQNVPPQVLASLVRAQDLALDLHYNQAEAMIRAAMPLAPHHPICRMFLVATLLARIQEQFEAGDKSVPKVFFVEVNRLIAQAKAQVRAFPSDPSAKVYLGAGYGMRGLAKLYAGKYFSSYFDGKKGARLLRQAVAQDPHLYNAYMGLGQFEYYCGTLGGVLQFFLALPGNPDKGLAMLDTCGQKGTYAAWPCRAYRARLMMSDRHDYSGAAAELVVLQARYPDNYDFDHSVFRALAAGVNTPALRAEAAGVLVRLDGGWRPPAYAHLDRDPLRLVLAKACLAAGDKPEARTYLDLLLAEPAPWSAQAAALMKRL